MRVKDVIEKLKEVDENLVVCVYDSVYEGYTSRLLFEVVEGDSYVDHDEKLVDCDEFLLL